MPKKKTIRVRRTINIDDPPKREFEFGCAACAVVVVVLFLLLLAFGG